MLHRDYVYFKNGQLDLLNNKTRLFKILNENIDDKKMTFSGARDSNFSENCSKINGVLEFSRPLYQKKTESKLDADGFRKVHVKMKKAKGLKFRDDD
jgi:hypothetical protein